MRGKFTELREARDLLKAARDENEDLKAALAEERANPLPGMKVPVYDIRRDSSKRGAPYDRHFEDTIAPAMLDTGATPEQINEIIRKPQLNAHTYTHTPTHTHFTFTHIFRRSVRAAVLRAVRVAHGPALRVVVAG